MSKTKQGGKTRQHKQRPGKRLGIKLFGGQSVSTGQIIVRQRGTRILAGTSIGVGRDHTLFALQNGTVAFGTRFGRTVAHVVPAQG